MQALEEVIRLFELGLVDEAHALVVEVLNTEPENTEALVILAGILILDQQFLRAQEYLLSALLKDPENIDAINNLAAAFIGQEKYSEAEKLIREKLHDRSVSLDVLKNYAVSLEGIDKFKQANELYVKISKIEESREFAHLGCIRIFMKIGDFVSAVASLDVLLREFPNSAIGYFLAGNVQRIQGNYQEAEKFYGLSILNNNAHYDSWNNLGVLLKSQSRFAEAVDCFRKCIEYRPSEHFGYLNLSQTLQKMQRFDDAIAVLNKGLEHAVGNREMLLTQIGAVFRKLGNLDQAIYFFEEALKIDRSNSEIFSEMLFVANYSTLISPAKLKDLYDEFSRRFEMPILNSSNSDFSDVMLLRDEKICIAFFSGDFCQHVVMKFFLPILRELDREKFKVICVSTSQHFDEVTQEVISCSDEFLRISTLSDVSAKKLLHKKRIHVAVDLSGHTGYNRLLLFARRIAPIQISMIGYGHTTGLKSVDFYLQDKYSLEGKVDQFFSEKFIKMSRVFPMPALSDVSRLEVPPFKRNGFVTFGSLSRLTRLNDDVLNCWSKIFLEVEDSQLILDQHAFKDVYFRSNFLQKLSSYGIDANRVVLRCSVPHLLSYDDIDISLDPFPHSAGTTNYEALWMGVPTVSLEGELPLGRIGTALLKTLNLNELIAHSQDDYIEIATFLARDPEYLMGLRDEIKNRIRDSKICDVQSFVREMEEKICDIVASTL